MTIRQKAPGFVIACNAFGLPEPTPEYHFALPRRRWRFDWAWPAHKVALEVEGGAWKYGRHNRGKGYIDDMEKYNAAILDGWLLLRVTPDQVSDGCAFVLLRQAFEMRQVQ